VVLYTDDLVLTANSKTELKGWRDNEVATSKTKITVGGDSNCKVAGSCAVCGKGVGYTVRVKWNHHVINAVECRVKVAQLVLHIVTECRLSQRSG